MCLARTFVHIWLFFFFHCMCWPWHLFVWMSVLVTNNLQPVQLYWLKALKWSIDVVVWMTSPIETNPFTQYIFMPKIFTNTHILWFCVCLKRNSFWTAGPNIHFIYNSGLFSSLSWVTTTIDFVHIFPSNGLKKQHFLRGYPYYLRKQWHILPNWFNFYYNWWVYIAIC